MIDDSEIKNNIKKSIFEARSELLVKNNSLKAIELLSNITVSNNHSDYIFFKNSLAQAYFENRDYVSAAAIYQEIGEKFHEGYCYLLLKNPDITEALWEMAPINSSVLWGRSLLEFINHNVKQNPTFIQIRNFLESDLGYFIKSDNNNYAEAVIKYADFLFNINPETYKFIGRALMNNGFPNQAVDFLLKSQKVFPQDSEVYYNLAQYCCIAKSYTEAENMLKRCLELNIYFTPARAMLETIKKRKV